MECEVRGGEGWVNKRILCGCTQVMSSSSRPYGQTVARQAPLSMGILQARILEWFAISSSRESSWPRDWTRVSCASCIGRQILNHWATREERINEFQSMAKRFRMKSGFTLKFINLLALKRRKRRHFDPHCKDDLYFFLRLVGFSLSHL